MNLLLFICITAALGWLSRHSLRDPRSHGFYRFMAWECLLLLFLHNRAFWFVERFAPHQLISWCLLFASLALVCCAGLLLRQHGAHDTTRHDPALLGFEKTAHLVSHGVYAHIRHPLYASLLLLVWGLYAKQPSWWPGLGLALLASWALAQAATVEENENVAYFGPAYHAYMQHTYRFIPGLW